MAWIRRLLTRLSGHSVGTKQAAVESVGTSVVESPPRVRSRMQFGPGEGPEVYFPHGRDPLGSWFATFIWHHHDLCLFHQVIDRDIRRRSEWLDELTERYARERDAAGWDDEGANIGLARLDRVIGTLDSETRSMQRYADQLFVVGLWAMAEQYLARTLVYAEDPSEAGQAREAPHRWPILRQRFATFGVDLSATKSFDGANERRVANNKIKHAGAVDAELAAFENFHGREGASLERGEVPIPLQFYSDPARGEPAHSRAVQEPRGRGPGPRWGKLTTRPVGASPTTASRTFAVRYRRSSSANAAVSVVAP